MRWQQKLTKEERKHLRKNGITTLYELKEIREWQTRLTDKVVCWDCKSIARKVGIE